jgi:hypothetical protein
MSGHVTACPQSVTPHYSHSVYHNNCKQTIMFMSYAILMMSNSMEQHKYQILYETWENRNTNLRNGMKAPAINKFLRDSTALKMGPHL